VVAELPRWRRVDGPVTLAADPWDRNVILDAELRRACAAWQVPRSALAWRWFWSGPSGEAELFTPDAGHIPAWAQGLSVIVVVRD